MTRDAGSARAFDEPQDVGAGQDDLGDDEAGRTPTASVGSGPDGCRTGVVTWSALANGTHTVKVLRGGLAAYQCGAVVSVDECQPGAGALPAAGSGALDPVEASEQVRHLGRVDAARGPAGKGPHGRRAVRFQGHLGPSRAQMNVVKGEVLTVRRPRDQVPRHLVEHRVQVARGAGRSRRARAAWSSGRPAAPAGPRHRRARCRSALPGSGRRRGPRWPAYFAGRAPAARRRSPPRGFGSAESPRRYRTGSTDGVPEDCLVAPARS